MDRESIRSDLKQRRRQDDVPDSRSISSSSVKVNRLAGPAGSMIAGLARDEELFARLRTGGGSARTLAGGREGARAPM